MKQFTIDSEHELILNEENGFWDCYRNGELLSKKAKKLFKYYAMNINNVDALLNSYFHMSDPSHFNDPFDCNINIIRKSEKIDTSKMQTVQRNVIKDIGIVSFSETIDNHLMWAHYTNNYRGFALEFKGDEMSASQKPNQLLKHTLTRVIYPEKIRRIKQSFPFAQLYLLSTKMKHWEYEKEWRFIGSLGSKNDRILNYDPVQVKAIHVGHRMIDEDKSAYRIMLSIHEKLFPKIPIYVVYPHPEELALKFEKVLN